MISENEAAKYPFLKEAVKLVDVLNINIEDLADPTFRNVLNRAENRVFQAILKGETSAELNDSLTELLSFPIANMFVSVIGNNYLSRRYALSEARRVNRLLDEENEIHIEKIARSEFDWSCRLVKKNLDSRLHQFELHFSDYLRNASAFREPKWKLVNRLLSNGYVLLTKPDINRLLREETQRKILSFVTKHTRLALHESIQSKIHNISKVFEENRKQITGEKLPLEVSLEALPPCIKNAFEGLMAGRRAGHMERFALTSFLINVGMETEDIVNLFTSVTDFDEQFTRYQIEHIAGLRGSRTKYTPPTCTTLQTHGVCYNPDNLCSKVNHPLSYYRNKIRTKNQDQKIKIQ